jgi:hypothetical protein
MAAVIHDEKTIEEINKSGFLTVERVEEVLKNIWKDKKSNNIRPSLIRLLEVIAVENILIHNVCEARLGSRLILLYEHVWSPALITSIDNVMISFLDNTSREIHIPDPKDISFNCTSNQLSVPVNTHMFSYSNSNDNAYIYKHFNNFSCAPKQARNIIRYYAMHVREELNLFLTDRNKCTLSDQFIHVTAQVLCLVLITSGTMYSTDIDKYRDDIKDLVLSFVITQNKTEEKEVKDTTTIDNTITSKSLKRKHENNAYLTSVLLSYTHTKLVVIPQMFADHIHLLNIMKQDEHLVIPNLYTSIIRELYLNTEITIHAEDKDHFLIGNYISESRVDQIKKSDSSLSSLKIRSDMFNTNNLGHVILFFYWYLRDAMIDMKTILENIFCSLSDTEKRNFIYALIRIIAYFQFANICKLNMDIYSYSFETPVRLLEKLILIDNESAIDDNETYHNYNEILSSIHDLYTNVHDTHKKIRL